VNGGRHRDGDQGPDDAQEGAADERGDDRKARCHLHGVFHHSWIEEIILQESIDDVKGGRGDPDRDSLGQGHQRDDDPGDSRTDHGYEVE